MCHDFCWLFFSFNSPKSCSLSARAPRDLRWNTEPNMAPIVDVSGKPKRGMEMEEQKWVAWNVGAEEMDFFHFCWGVWLFHVFFCIFFLFFDEGSINVETSRFDKMDINDAVYFINNKLFFQSTCMSKCVWTHHHNNMARGGQPRAPLTPPHYVWPRLRVHEFWFHP